MTTEATTIGRILALRVAATESPDEAHELIQNHLGVLDADSGRMVLAVALETVTEHIVRPALDDTEDPAHHRGNLTAVANRIACGPTEEQE